MPKAKCGNALAEDQSMCVFKTSAFYMKLTVSLKLRWPGKMISANETDTVDYMQPVHELKHQNTCNKRRQGSTTLLDS